MIIKKKKRKLILVLIVTVSFLLSNTVLHSSYALQEEEQYVDAIVFFEDGVNVHDIPGVEIKYYYDSLNGFAGSMSYSTYKWLEKAWFVRAIDLNSKTAAISAYDPGGGGSDDLLDWGIDDIDAERVWGGCEDTYDVLLNNPAGDNVNVCIIDSGIDYNHPDLSGNYKGGWDFVDDDNDPMDGDPYSHGTHVAGIIGAEENDGGVIGIAPKVDLYAVRVFDAEGEAYIGDIAAAIDWAINYDMDIISMSLTIDSAATSEIVNESCKVAYEEGIILVAASGNAPTQYDTEVLYPAKYDYVIAVGAVDIDHTHPWWSCYGDELDVVAPGVNIYSTIIGSWGFMSGTSMAAPMVAGVCALILSVNPTLSNDDVKGILKDTATDLGYNYGYFGEGLINAQLAVATAIGDTTNPSLNITSPSGTVSDIVTISAIASDSYGIFKVQYKIDNGIWLDDETAPYQWQWNTNSYSDGARTITCRAWDTHGNYAEDQRTVMVNNVPSGGGGCPILYVYNGTEYVEEGLLDIHNLDGIDVVTSHSLNTAPGVVNHRFLLRLIEHPKTISHIDRVQLFGRLRNGLLVPIPLISAVHSTLGQVRWKLWFSDDKRVDLLGADHNEGFSEYIDLRFIAFSHRRFTEFIFYIEGNNRLIK